jgi:hypothetical protein
VLLVRVGERDDIVPTTATLPKTATSTHQYTGEDKPSANNLSHARPSFSSKHEIHDRGVDL